MKTNSVLVTLVLSGLVLAGCGMGVEPNAAARAAEVAEEMAAARAAMMAAERDPAQVAWSRALTLAEISQSKSEAALAAADAGDMQGFLTTKSEAMLAHRAATQAWATAQNYSEAGGGSAMATQQAWEAAQLSWDNLESRDIPGGM